MNQYIRVEMIANQDKLFVRVYMIPGHYIVG